MASVCGIQTAESRTVPDKEGHDIFITRRFDRTDEGKRIHMASALTLLGLPQGSGADTGHGYPDIASLIISTGVNVEKDLKELYRRVAFNICIGNSDDHFKNHSFLLTKDGWTLSPVYDINPSNYRSHSLLIDMESNQSSLDRLFKAHKMYFIDKETAHDIISEVASNMKQWRRIAYDDCKISFTEAERFAERFGIPSEWSMSKGIKK